MMTGRELILYILANGLENEPVFDGRTFVGFITKEEAATKFNVGTATILAWTKTGMLDSIQIGDMIYICDNIEAPAEEKSVSITINVNQ